MKLNISRVFLPLVYSYLSSRPKLRVSLESKLIRAGIFTSPEDYIARIFAALTTTVVAIVVLLVVTYFFIPFIFPYVVLLASPIIAAVVLLYWYWPNIKARSIAEAITEETPYFAVFLSIVSRTNTPLPLALRYIKDQGLVQAISSFIDLILSRLLFFGKSIFEAIHEVADIVPSREYSDLMRGYVTSMMTGSDVASYVDSALRHMIEVKLTNIKALVDTIVSALTGLLTGISLIFMFIVVQQVAQFMSGEIGAVGAEISPIMFLLMAVLPIPLLFLLGRAFIAKPRRYPILEASLTIAVVAALAVIHQVWLIQIPLFPYVATLLPLLVFSTLYYRNYARRKSLEKGFTEFLRDLTNMRRSGFPVEKCFVSLSARNYGAFTSDLRRIADQIQAGVPIREIIADLSKRTPSTFVHRLSHLLLATIELGGASVESLDTLSNFAIRMREVEDEIRAKSREPVVIAFITVAVMAFLLSFMPAISQLMMKTATMGATPGMETTATAPAASPEYLDWVMVASSVLLFILAGAMYFGDIAASSIIASAGVITLMMLKLLLPYVLEFFMGM
ncbi:MAG: hypothetical protein DRN15_01460 [Thermoprotei archaeon]|nr:MAG: hypothetical protein DRN15_01460 [Thermoprotei archaeon]RLF25862.1 MAG: hypothetical protein DRM97_00355 [Thermoprotei archaeon]